MSWHSCVRMADNPCQLTLRERPFIGSSAIHVLALWELRLPTREINLT
jgi:hypothetical protein